MARFTSGEVAELWERRHAGEANRSIGRRMGRSGAAIRALVEASGGVRPAVRHRWTRQLSQTEREEISRGVAAGESLRVIAAGWVGRLRRSVASWVATVAGIGIELTQRIGRRGSGAGGPSGANWQPMDLCGSWSGRNSPFGGRRSRSRPGCVTPTTVWRRCR